MCMSLTGVNINVIMFWKAFLCTLMQGRSAVFSVLPAAEKALHYVLLQGLNVQSRNHPCWWPLCCRRGPSSSAGTTQCGNGISGLRCSHLTAAQNIAFGLRKQPKGYQQTRVQNTAGFSRIKRTCRALSTWNVWWATATYCFSTCIGDTAGSIVVRWAFVEA